VAGTYRYNGSGRYVPM